MRQPHHRKRWTWRKLMHELRKQPILVIDDDPAILSMVSDILDFEGYDVEKAMNGAEGLAVLERTRPSLVLLDMRMPILDGWDFARILRERGMRLPIVIMTAAQDARKWAQEIGAQGTLAKPFDLEELVRVVADAQSDA